MLWRGSAATPVGPIYFTVDESRHAMVHASFHPEQWVTGKVRKNSEFHDAFHDYVDGNLSAFDALTVVQDGTEFARAVYSAMRKVAPGDVITYGELARRAGHPRAARAVGTVCSRNEVVLVIPCHRVVSSTGIGGYGFDISWKKTLLEHEGAI